MGNGSGTIFTQRLGQSVRFDRIADRRARAVRFHKPDLGWQYAGILARILDETSLRLRAGQRNTVGVAVLIHGCPEDHALNGIAVLDRAGKSLEQHHAGAFAAHESAGRRIKRRASALG